MIDNRVVLPLDRVRRQAAWYCGMACATRGHHDDVCLMPLLEERDRRLASDQSVWAVSPDCGTGKHVACTGCACDHHGRGNGT